MQGLGNVVRGFLMGAADIVPGVSGGTVALVLGIYGRLVESIKHASSGLGNLARFDGPSARRNLATVEWRLVIPLLVGIGLAIVSFARVLEHALVEYPSPMAGLFLGLVGGSAVVAWQLVRRRDAARLATVGVTAIVVFVLLGLQEGTAAEGVVQLSAPTTWAFFGSGAVAIWAMILPGISGSFILVMLGMYGPVLAAVNDREIGSLAIFTLGAVIGLSVFSQVLHRALAAAYDTVMAALIGLMIGSLRVLWPWPAGVESTVLGGPDDAITATAGLCVVGFAAVVAIHAASRRLRPASLERERAEIATGSGPEPTPAERTPRAR